MLRDPFRFSCLSLVAIALLTSCSNRANKGVETSASFQTSLQEINSRDFEGAIATLEPLSRAQPQNVEVQRRLMHAYAGASGFEAPKFKDSLDRLARDKGKKKLQASVDEFKRIHSLRTIGASEVRSFRAHRVTTALVDAVDEIPLLTKIQYARLNQAIDLYEKNGFDYRTSSKDDNFQWGLLYSYRMLSNLRYLAEELDRMSAGKNNHSNQQIERVFIRAWNMVSWDAFHAYKLFRHSYDKLQEIGMKAEDFLSRISGRRINARLLEESNSATEVVQIFLNENREITADLLARIEDRIREGNFEGMLNQAFRDFREKTPEVRYHEDRMRAVLRVYVDEYREDNQSGIKELRDLFDDQLRQEVKSAYFAALREETLDSFTRLYRDEHSHFRTAIDLADTLAKDVDTKDLTADLKPHVLALRDHVDEAQLRMVKAEAEGTARDVGDILKEEQSYYQQNLDFLKKRLEQRVRNVGQIANEEVLDPAK
ncbi:MAG: hypothetical protein ACXVBE_06385, partial [Bdellovibrionota bacterium]